MNTKTAYLAGITALVIGLSSVSIAEETYSMNGQLNNTIENKVQPVGDQYVVVQISATGVLSFEDASNPLQDAEGHCGGSVLVTMGKPEGTGYCTVTDSTGEIIVTSWTSQELNDKGGNSGIWELVGGTGRWADATASGTFSDMPDEDGKTSKNMITGELKFK